MSSISSLDIISVAIHILRIFLCIPASAAVGNPNGIKTLFPVFNNGPRSLPRNYPDCIILYS